MTRQRKPRRQAVRTRTEFFQIIPRKPILIPIEGTAEEHARGEPFRVDTRSAEGARARQALCELFSDPANRPPGLDVDISSAEATTRLFECIESALAKARTESRTPEVLYSQAPNGVTLVVATASKLATIPRVTWH